MIPLQLSSTKLCILVVFLYCQQMPVHFHFVKMKTTIFFKKVENCYKLSDCCKAWATTLPSLDCTLQQYLFCAVSSLDLTFTFWLQRTRTKVKKSNLFYQQLLQDALPLELQQTLRLGDEDLNEDLSNTEQNSKKDCECIML